MTVFCNEFLVFLTSWYFLFSLRTRGVVASRSIAKMKNEITLK